MTDALKNTPDEYEAKGAFVIRPAWPGHADEDDSFEVTRPATKLGKRLGVMPGAVSTCPDKATAQAICDLLNQSDYA